MKKTNTILSKQVLLLWTANQGCSLSGWVLAQLPKLWTVAASGLPFTFLQTAAKRFRQMQNVYLGWKLFLAEFLHIVRKPLSVRVGPRCFPNREPDPHRFSLGQTWNPQRLRKMIMLSGQQLQSSIHTAFSHNLHIFNGYDGPIEKTWLVLVIGFLTTVVGRCSTSALISTVKRTTWAVIAARRRLQIAPIHSQTRFQYRYYALGSSALRRCMQPASIRTSVTRQFPFWITTAWYTNLALALRD